MSNATRNNVHVSGKVLQENQVTPYTTHLIVGINDNLSIPVLVQCEQWERFKENSSDTSAVTISGKLKEYQDSDQYRFAIDAKGFHSMNLTCFQNLLKDYLDESGIYFEGPVRLLSKSDYNTDSELLLKNLTFETCTRYPIVFEAVALRKLAPFFDKIEEGTKLYIKADLFRKYPPYWRVKAIPKIA